MINQFSLKTLLLTRQKKRAACDLSGFTLTELLVSIIIGGLIVTSVTAIVTDIVQASKEEELRTKTQQEIQRALSFIASDLESATYIYTGEEIYNTRGSLAALSDSTILDVNSNLRIVLAFWKPDLLPYTPGGANVPRDCTLSNISSDTTEEECQNLQTERRTYTLVVYTHDINPTNTWSGESVIRRYELRKFDDDDTFSVSGEDYLTLNISEDSLGDNIYVDPVSEAASFSRWPFDINDTNLLENVPTIARNNFSNPVLVDFVDDHTNNPGNLPTCLDEDDNDNGILDTGEDDNNNGVLDVYSRTPAASESKSFFACVRQAGFQGDFSQGNQDVIIYLRGNPSERDGLELASSSTPLPTLQTQVMLRGVRDKFIND